MADEKQKLTIAEAVKAGWASKPTLYRHMKSGKLSVDKSQPGKTLNDISELVRVFGEPVSRKGSDETDVAGLRLSDLERDNAVLQERLRSAEKEVASLTQARQEAQEREEWLRGQLDAQTKLLSASEAPRGFWGRLFGKKSDRG